MAQKHQKEKIPAPKSFIIVLTVLALAPPLAAVALATAKYFKDRSHPVAESHISNEQAEGFRKRLEEAADKKFEIYEQKSPTFTVSNATSEQWRKPLGKAAEDHGGVLTVTDEKQASILVKKQNLAALLEDIPKRGKDISLSSKGNIEGEAADDWVSVEIVFDTKAAPEPSAAVK